MQLIYRVEHKETSTGPFQTIDEFTQELASKAGELFRCPHPYEDGLVPKGGIPYCMVFGCVNLEQLAQWILLGESSHENVQIVNKLKNLGFIVRAFVVQEHDLTQGKSGRQVLFYPGEATDEGLFEDFDLDVLLSTAWAQ